LAFALQFIIIIVIVVVVVVVLDIASFSVRLGSQEHVTTSDIVTHVCERQWCVSVVGRAAAEGLSPSPPRRGGGGLEPVAAAPGGHPSSKKTTFGRN